MTKQKYKVLIIDDSKAILEHLAAVFKKGGYTVKTMDNPVRAFELIQRESFKIVITDIEMPEMNGLELLKKIKSYNGMIQVVVISGYLTIHNTLNAFRYGAENLFFKPIDINGLIRAVDACAAKLDRVNDLLRELERQGIKHGITEKY